MCYRLGTLRQSQHYPPTNGGRGDFGLSAALHEQISLQEGAVVNSNFHDYRVARLSESPEVFVSIIENDEAPGGVGEPGVPPVAPALCNAIYAATGNRIRRLPVASQLI